MGSRHRADAHKRSQDHLNDDQPRAPATRRPIFLMRTLAQGSRASFALVAVKCGHLLVLAEDCDDVIPLPTPLQPQTEAIERVMVAAMRVACGL